MIEQLNFNNALKKNSHYSPAVREGNSVYISGQLPINPVTGEKCTGNLKEQARQCFKNVEEILKLAGGDKNRIVKTTAYITDIAFWDELNEAYSEFFGDYKPARSIVAVSQIHFDMLVEIEAVALLKE
jgi:2-iminobutanoate/2-iminopropanoate deaminase